MWRQSSLRNSLLIVFQTSAVTDVGVRSKKVVLALFSIKDNQIEHCVYVSVCVCVYVCVRTHSPIKDSRFGDSLDSCCLLCSLRGDEQMVCWSAAKYTNTRSHTHWETHTHAHAHACSILSPQLYPPFIFSIAYPSAGQCHSEGVCVCVLVSKRELILNDCWMESQTSTNMSQLVTHPHSCVYFRRLPLISWFLFKTISLNFFCRNVRNLLVA